MAEELYILICMPWDAWESAGLNRSMPSLKLKCRTCGRDVAMDRRNEKRAAEFKMEPVCTPCYALMLESVDSAGFTEPIALVGGREMNMAEGAVTALRDADINRRRN